MFQGTGSVLCIDLNIATVENELSIDQRAFAGMPHLQFLRFKSPNVYGKNNNKLILPEGLNNLPRKLRVLRWDEFPLICLPPTFRAEKLVILEMRNSCIEKLWDWEEAPVSNLELFCVFNLKHIMCVLIFLLPLSICTAASTPQADGYVLLIELGKGP